MQDLYLFGTVRRNSINGREKFKEHLLHKSTLHRLNSFLLFRPRVLSKQHFPLKNRGSDTALGILIEVESGVIKFRFQIRYRDKKNISLNGAVEMDQSKFSTQLTTEIEGFRSRPAGPLLLPPPSPI